MKVDRAKFLALTGAIGAATALAMASASGCTVVQKSDGDGGTVTPEPTSTDAGTSTGDGGGEGEDKDAGKPPSDCLGAGTGDAGTLDCAGLATNGCDIACQNYGDAFKPEIARAIADCLVKLPTCEGSDAVKACVEGALAKACDDPTAKTYCTPLATACGKNPGDAGANVTQASCEALAKGLSATGRESFTSCITEGQADYCTADSSWCIDTLK